MLDILLDGIKKFGGEIVSVVLLGLLFWLFPGVRNIFRKLKNPEDDNSATQRVKLTGYTREDLIQEILHSLSESERNAWEVILRDTPAITKKTFDIDAIIADFNSSDPGIDSFLMLRTKFDNPQPVFTTQDLNEELYCVLKLSSNNSVTFYV